MPGSCPASSSLIEATIRKCQEAKSRFALLPGIKMPSSTKDKSARKTSLVEYGRRGLAIALPFLAVASPAGLLTPKQLVTVKMLQRCCVAVPARWQHINPLCAASAR